MTQPLRSAPPGPASSTEVALDRQAQLDEMKRGRRLWTLATWRARLQANPPPSEPGGDLWQAIQKTREWAAEEEQ